jgi:hypothetical protein
MPGSSENLFEPDSVRSSLSQMASKVAAKLDPLQPGSIEQVLREIQNARTREAALDQELTALLANRITLQQQISSLQTLPDDIAAVHDTAQRMVRTRQSEGFAILCIDS